MKPKRTHVYCMNPVDYEIAGCRHCGGNNIQYSEWAHLMWCYDCEKEYRPEHWGVFDGPVPIGIGDILGLSFDRIEVSTGRLVKFGTEEWSKSWP